MYPDPEFLRNHTARPEDFLQTRRQFLNRFGLGLGTLGLATLLGENPVGAADTPENFALPPLAPRPAPLPAKARHVVHIFAQGAPSQVDTWDPKPALSRFDGKTIPGSAGVGYASPFLFTRHGRSGI